MSKMKGYMAAMMAMAMMTESMPPLYFDRPNGTHGEKLPPKGSKLYFFNMKGEFSTDHMLRTDVVFQCFAINDKNAKKKYAKSL